jgi:hypothetical protein
VDTDLSHEQSWDVASRFGDPDAMAEKLFHTLPAEEQEGWRREAAFFSDDWNTATPVEAWIQQGNASCMQVYDAVSYATLRDRNMLWLAPTAGNPDVLVSLVFPCDAQEAVKNACEWACLEEDDYDGTADERFKAAENAHAMTQAAIYNFPYVLALRRAKNLLGIALQELQSAPESSACELISSADDIMSDYIFAD